MSIQAVGKAIENFEVGGATKLILLLLANCHNKHTGQCNPSQERLAQESGLSERTVRDHLRLLEQAKLIKRETVNLGRGKGSETHFLLLFLDRQNFPVQKLDRRNDVNRPAKSRKLDRRETAAPYKEEPEIEPERTGTHAREVFKTYSEIAERVGWVKHSKLTDDLRKRINGRLRDHSLEEVLSFLNAMAGGDMDLRRLPRKTFVSRGARLPDAARDLHQAFRQAGHKCGAAIGGPGEQGSDRCGSAG